MLIQILLCLYLVLTVIDICLLGVATGSWIRILLSAINLIFFVFILLQYSVLFQHAAAKEGRRIVFTPVVFLFFTLAVGLLAGTLFYGAVLSWAYLLVSLLITLILFSLLSSIFDLFPFRSAGIQYVLWGGIVILGIGWGIQFLSSLREVIPAASAPTQEAGPEELTGAEQQIGEVILEATWAQTVTGILDELLEPFPTAETGETTTVLTYRYLLPYLDRTIWLDQTSAQPTFSLLAATDPVYPAFQRAWGMNMIWTNINPDRQVRCGNMMVILGLAQGRQADKDAAVIDVYRQQATSLGMLGGCSDQEQIATRGDIPEFE